MRAPGAGMGAINVYNLMNRAVEGDIMRIAVVGLGEAGRLYAEGFAGLGGSGIGFRPGRRPGSGGCAP